MKAIVKTNGRFFNEFPTVFDELFGKEAHTWPLGNYSGNHSVPAVNIKETETGYEVEMAAPGLNKEAFKIELNNDVLVISAQQESKTEDKDKKTGYTRKEFSYQSFQRSFKLPENSVEKDKISAKYTDGILHVSVPKVTGTSANAARVISVE